MDNVELLSGKLGISKEKVDDLLKLKEVSPLRFGETWAKVQGKEHKKQNEIIADDRHVRLILGGNRCLPFYEKVLCGDGSWKEIKDVQVGEVIKDGEGKDTVVVRKINSGTQPVYRLSFHNGGKIDATLNHEFPAAYRHDGVVKKRTVKELLDRGEVSVSKKAKLQSTVIQHEERKDLLLDPYLMGVLLGDGGFRKWGYSYSDGDVEVIDRVAEILEKIGAELRYRGRYTYAIIFPDRVTGQPTILEQEVRGCGLENVLDGDKFIPDKYKYSSVNQRLAVLAGLIDTDGSKDEFVSKSEALANDFAEIVRSLCGYATVSKTQKSCVYKGERKWGTYWRVYWRLDQELPLTCKEKQTFVSDFCKSRRYDYRILQSIDYIGDFETYDLTVLADNHCFIAGDWIVTGNSGKTFCAMRLAAMYLLDDYHYTGRRGEEVIRDLGPGKDIWVFSESFELQETTTQPTLLDLIPEEEIEEMVYRKGRVVKSFRIKSTGKMVTFKSYEQGRAKVQGAGLRAVFMDEEPPKEIFEELLTRRAAGVDLDVFISMTPVEGMSWVYHTLYQSDDKESIGVHIMGWDDNPWLTEKQKKELLNVYRAMGMSDDEIEMRRSGKFISLTGLVCDWYNPHKNLRDVNSMPLNKCSHYRVFDFGHSDYSVALFAAFDAKGNCYVYDGINEKGLTPETFAATVKSHSMDFHYIRSWGDSANAEWIATLNDKGIRTKPVKKMRKKRLQDNKMAEIKGTSQSVSWQRALTDVMRKFGDVQEGTGEPKLYIADHLRQYDDRSNKEVHWLEQQFMQLRWAEKRTRDGKEVTSRWDDTRKYGHHFDGIAALSYLLYMYEYTQESRGKSARLQLPAWEDKLLYNDGVI